MLSNLSFLVLVLVIPSVSAISGALYTDTACDSSNVFTINDISSGEISAFPLMVLLFKQQILCVIMEKQQLLSTLMLLVQSLMPVPKV